MSFSQRRRRLWLLPAATAIMLFFCMCSGFEGTDPASPSDAAGATNDVAPASSDAETDSDAGRAVGEAGPGCGAALACMRTVFVTDATFDGNLGDAKGADAKCQAQADLSDNPLVKGRRFIAWIAGSSSPNARILAQGRAPYVRTDGTVVAANWERFASAQHETPLDYNQYGFEAGVISSHAWTGTLPDGGSLAPHCSNWTTSDSGTGTVGGINDINGSWTDEEERPCTTEARLYCVEM